MNNKTSRAVFAVLRALLDPMPDGPKREPVCSDELRDALAVLADAAHRQLGAGPTGDHIRAAWADARPLVMTARQRTEASALVEQWSTQAPYSEDDSTTTESGGIAAQCGRDAHDVEADAAGAVVRADVAVALSYVLGGLPGMVLGLDLEAAAVMKDIDRSYRHDAGLIGQVGAFYQCRVAIAALLPSAEPYVYAPAADAAPSPGDAPF